MKIVSMLFAVCAMMVFSMSAEAGFRGRRCDRPVVTHLRNTTCRVACATNKTLTAASTAVTNVVKAPVNFVFGCAGTCNPSYRR